MVRSLVVLLLSALVAACAGTSGSTAPVGYDTRPPGDMLGGWYDGTGPRGRSGGGP